MAEPDFGSSPAIELRRERSFSKAQGRESRVNRRSLAATPVTSRSKPAMELYKPPSRRISTNLDGMNYLFASDQQTAFHMNGFGEPRGIQHSKSSGSVSTNNHSPPRVHFQLDSKSKKSPPSSSQSPTKFKSQATIQMVTPSCLGELPLERPASILKRSKSLGATDIMTLSGNEGSSTTSESISELPELESFGTFSSDVEAAIKKALEDPNRLSGRHLMELVRHMFTRLVESSRFAEPAARLAITIIEREKNCTFLEALLNTCREWFQERDRLLKPSNGTSPQRWVAFITFLNEMYSQLKRREHQLLKQAKIEGAPPGLILLSLLCECCQVSLKAPSLSLSETECLFFVLSSIGRDIEMETPAKLQGILTALRDAFLAAEINSGVRKTLLQLVELQAARWQLPAAAVMYYYPSSGNSSR